MPREHPAPIHMGLLSAGVLAIGACSHVADVLTSTGTALRRHSDESSKSAQPAEGVTKEQSDAIVAAQKAALDECKASFATPELDPIRQKVEFWRGTEDGPLPFEIAVNDSFPTAEERPVIAKWASLRDACLQHMQDLPYVPPGASALQTTVLKQMRSFGQQVSSDITELTISLYQQKLTYGEFGRKRYEIAKSQGTFALAFQQAAVGSENTQHVLEDLQSAQTQFTDTLEAFAKYVRTVSARKPKTVRVRGSGS